MWIRPMKYTYGEKQVGLGDGSALNCEGDVGWDVEKASATRSLPRSQNYVR